MKNISQNYSGQCALMDWVSYQGANPISKNRLRVICKSIEKQFDKEESSLYFEKYLNVLLAIGLLEYQKKEQFSLAPSTIISYSTYYVAINIPKRLILSCNPIRSLYNGHLVFFNKTEDTLELECEIRKPVMKIFSSIPDLKSIITKWEQIEMDYRDLKKIRKLSNRGWKDTQKIIAGVHIIGENKAANRYLYFNHKWFKLPYYSKSPDAQSIGYQATIEGETSMDYNSDNRELTISTYQFPIILQRIIIRIAKFDFNYKDNKLMCRNINQSQFEILKRKIYGRSR